MPQVWEATGVSQDYFNEYVGFKWYHDARSLEKIAEKVRERPVKKYEERFPPRAYEEVITDQNRQRVQQLDELADYVNAQFNDAKGFTEADVKRVVNKAHFLIWEEEMRW